jgi:hypothetical protein
MFLQQTAGDALTAAVKNFYLSHWSRILTIQSGRFKTGTG